jgi:hypothetical protein
MIKYDLSDKGIKEFYSNWFKKNEDIIKDTGLNYEGKCKLLFMNINNLKSYNLQVEMYKEQIKILWETKKSNVINGSAELKEYGKVSIKTIEIDQSIKKHTERLKCMSSSFESDLEKIMRDDKDVKMINFSNLN